MNPAGVINTFSFDEKGGGEEGSFFNPLVTYNGITADAAGNLYVSSQADGRGDVEVVMSVDGVASNNLRIQIK
ncbi:MAG: hypothetical protein ACREEM_32175 [Blastocatellia bacterium]